MSPALEARIREVRIEKATKAFEAGVRVYGSLESALRAYDSTSRQEAISMLTIGMTCRIYKVDGVICVS